MANTYPLISNGHVTSQYPYTEEDIFNVQQSTVDAGFSVGLPKNNTPLKRFVITYTLLTRDEVTAIENFFQNMRGRLGYFTFTDDAGNNWTNTRFDIDELDIAYDQINSYGFGSVALYATLNSFVPFNPNLGDQGSDSGPTPGTQET
jgi:hypothetical protein